MAVAEVFRYWFIVLYLLGWSSFIFMLVQMQTGRGTIEKRTGPLPTPAIVIPLGIPLVILLTHFGEIVVALPILRWLAVLLSLYFVVMLPWMMWTLGRFAVPGAGVYHDHELISTGPFRFVRHPLYSAVVVLWLSAALGTVNWLLLVLWPAFVILVALVPVRHEEALLKEKFGAEYERYAAGTAKLVPGIW